MNNYQQHHQQQQNEEFRNINNDDDLLGELNDLLNDLNPSNSYIKYAKDWILRYSNKSNLIINTIVQRVPVIEPPEKRLFLLFLISEILHSCAIEKTLDHHHHHHQEHYITLLYQNLPSILSNTYYLLDNQQKDKIKNICNLWEERKIFNPNEIKSLKSNLKDVPPLGIASPGAIVTHLKLASNVTLPLNPTDINYYHLHQFDRSANNYSLYDSLRQFQENINAPNGPVPPNTQQQPQSQQ
ncbi:hypothetical protein CYY_000552 [Polysphondylium violaceum]|uniref:CID domain-containing protein n=1 Tax=Polysphondylium violaceum TaxID=133409 RepID=A0A8J4PZM7_9MYCE|nr:hypothetical protein CYY_000552 [Polysphondylium violaceum]